MSYHEELQERLDAVRPREQEKVHVVDTSVQEQKILDELDGEFEFAQYDLEESDILRTC